MEWYSWWRLDAMHPLLKTEISQISVADRLSLIDLLWDSIAENPDLLPVPEAQQQELDDRRSVVDHRRLANLESDPAAGSSWEAVKARIGQG
jgi:putative addiction module component (TIGR02574 family)